MTSSSFFDRVDTYIFGFRFPPYKDGYKKYLNLIAPSLPPRPKNRSVVQHRWAFWLTCALGGASAVLLTQYVHSLQLKA